MKKLYLEDVIEKYHLGGLVERIKITIKDKTLYTKFISMKKNLVGEVTASNIELDDCEFGIYDTSQLLKLIKITDSFITLAVETKGKITNKLLIADNVYNLEYALADIMLTPTIPIIDEPKYTLEANIDKEFITKFLKAGKALDTEIFSIEQTIDVDGKEAIKFILGIGDYTNKINFTLPTTKSIVPGVTIRFPLIEFEEILSANKEIVSGNLYISEDGLLKIIFVNEEGVKATYILVGKE